MEKAMPRSCREDQKEKVKLCLHVQHVYIHSCMCLCMIHSMCVVLLMLMPLAAIRFLMCNKFCGGAQAHLRSPSFSRMAFKRKLLNLCDEEMYSMHKH